MKKILITFGLLILFIIPVKAEENKLYFTQDGDRIYYDTDLYDEDKFINHLDMVPGKEYEDTLLIENGTDTKYTLYFKVKELEQTDLANELLDNIEMTVYLDEQKIYEGTARGVDTGEYVNLQEAIKIGDVYKNNTYTVRVITKLADSYSNIRNEEIAKIEWQFYAFYDEQAEHGYHEITPNPNTGDQHSKVIKILLSSLLLIIIFALLLITRRDKKRLNN